MTAILDRIKGWMGIRSQADDTEARFAQSTSELMTACKQCCDAGDEFVAFVSGFLAELKKMRHVIEGARYISEISSSSTASEAMDAQLPVIEAAITSVRGQIDARMQVLDKNLDALASLKKAVDKVQGQVDDQLIRYLNEGMKPLESRTERQRVAIRTLDELIREERIGFLKLANPLENLHRPEHLN